MKMTPKWLLALFFALSVGALIVSVSLCRLRQMSGVTFGASGIWSDTRLVSLKESKESLDLAVEWRQIERQTVASWRGDSAADIPKILHYVFKNEMAFEPYKPLIRSCLDLNPDWQVFLWRDSDSESFVQEHYKHFADKYRSYGDRLEKSDAIRYMILHKFGGIYLDMDVQCLKPFDELLQLPGTDLNSATTDGILAFLGEERREQTRILYGYSFCTMNSLMGSGAGHPFFQRAIDRMQSMPKVNHARLSTGPDFLTNVYYSWVNCSECQTGHPVHVFPARLVSPLMDTSLVKWEKKCEPYFKAKRQPNQPLTIKDVWKALGCAELVAKGWRFDDTDNATVAVHSFLHLGYGSQRRRQTFNLLTEFPRIKLASDIFQ